MSRKHTNATVSAAVQWLQRFQTNVPSALSPDESANWAQWSKDNSHFDEFSRAKWLWEKMGVLAAVARPTREQLEADDYDGSISIREWLARRDNPQ